MIYIDNWRFICPDCGSHSIYKIQKEKYYSPSKPHPRVYCEQCQRSYPNFYDKKKGHIRDVTEIDHTNISQ